MEKSIPALLSDHQVLLIEMKSTIKEKVISLLGKNYRRIKFNDVVCIHYITDYCTVDCRGIKLEPDGNIILMNERNLPPNQLENFEESLDELNVSSCYEILLALEDGSFFIHNV